MYTLPGFQQYLVLERSPGTSSHTTSGARRPDVKVLVPVGRVIKTHPHAHESLESEQSPGARLSPLVRMDLSRDSGEKIEVHAYDVHTRFGDLRSPSKLARLQLAALYAATSSLLPEPLSCATGVQTALQLLRQCWGNVPLIQEEQLQLISVATLGGHLASGLRLMVTELLDSSTQLAHLHPPHEAAANSEDNSASATTPSLDHTCYLDPEESVEGVYGGWCSNPRMRLSADEEKRVLRGWRRKDPSPPAWFRSGECRTVQVQPCPETASLVIETEQEICDCVRASGKGLCRSGFPLKALGILPLEREVHRELAGSWNAARGILKQKLAISPHEIRCRIKAWQDLVKPARACVEASLLSSLDLVPVETPHGRSFRLLRTAGGVPRPMPLDLLRVAVSPNTAQALRAFNPFLSESACRKLVQGINIWSQSCVLENRLQLLTHLSSPSHLDKMEPTLIKELQTRHVWDSEKHSKWLVFEVEGQLQIRPNQYLIAQHLLSNPGEIAQLNMGEGKTRVILPMMALHWTDGQQAGKRLVRHRAKSTTHPA